MTTLLGASCPLKAMIAYTHLMEWIPGKEPLVSGLLFCYDGFLFVLCPLLLVYVSNNTIIFLWIGLIINVISIVVFAIFYFPESPVYLLDQNKFGEFEAILNKIYKMNNVSEDL